MKKKSSLCFGFYLAFSFFCLEPHPSESTTSDASNALKLTVRDSIVLALENNRSLTVEKFDPAIAGTFAAEERSAFDSTLDAAFNFSDSSGQRTSGVGEFRSVENRQYQGSAGLAKRLPIGLETKAGLTITERESNVYTRLFSTRLGADLLMPVLRGFGEETNLVGVRLAEKDIELSRYELRGFILALAAQVEDNYWNLLETREGLRIYKTSLELAQKQLQETRDRIDVGELAEIDLAAAEGETALREKAVIDAQSAIQKSTLRFIQSMNPPLEDMWTADVQLLNEPEVEALNEGKVEDHIVTALSTRPDLFQARIEIEKQDALLVQTRNGLLPRLDFFITLGKTGYSDSFADSISNITKDNYDVSTGLTLSMPLGNRAAKARHSRTTFNKEKALAAYENFKQLVELDVRIAYAELIRAKQQISATRRATRLQEAKYQAELEKFRVGKSTNLLVLTTQRDLIASQLDEVDARIDFRKAIANLYLAEGTLLDQHQIVLPEKPME